MLKLLLKLEADVQPINKVEGSLLSRKQEGEAKNHIQLEEWEKKGTLTLPSLVGAKFTRVKGMKVVNWRYMTGLTGRV